MLIKTYSVSIFHILTVFQTVVRLNIFQKAFVCSDQFKTQLYDLCDHPSMAHESEYGSLKKMAEGVNDAELLKEKANKYFKGEMKALSSRWL